MDLHAVSEDALNNPVEIAEAIYEQGWVNIFGNPNYRYADIMYADTVTTIIEVNDDENDST